MEMKNVLRWIALPAAVIATYLITLSAFFLMFYLQTVLFKTDIESYNIFLQIIAPGAAAFLAIAAGWYVAPTHKKKSAIAVYVLMVFLIGMQFEREVATAEFWRLANMLIQVIVGGYAVWQIGKEKNI